MSKKNESPARIAENRKASYNYFFEERYEAGIVLQGWEVKALREGKVQLTDGYVVVKDGELFIIGLQINPLSTASTHVNPESQRTRKLLMHKDEIRRLIGKVEQRGYTLVPINLPCSRSQSRFFSVLRLSCSALPLASAISALTRPPL